MVLTGCLGKRRPGTRRHAIVTVWVLTWFFIVTGAAFAAPVTTVKATDTLRFAPAKVTITTGTVVKWTNASVLVHTVTADPAKATMPDSTALPHGAKPFDSGNLAPGETFSHAFTVPGVYRYFCKPHEGAKMWGTVVVKNGDS